MTYETGRATDVDPTNVETRDDIARFLSAFADARVVEAPKFDQERASGACLPRSFGPQQGTSSAHTFPASRGGLNVCCHYGARRPTLTRSLGTCRIGRSSSYTKDARMPRIVVATVLIVSHKPARHST